MTNKPTYISDSINDVVTRMIEQAYIDGYKDGKENKESMIDLKKFQKSDG